jgi:hypothetical protein
MLTNFLQFLVFALQITVEHWIQCCPCDLLFYGIGAYLDHLRAEHVPREGTVSSGFDQARVEAALRAVNQTFETLISGQENVGAFQVSYSVLFRFKVIIFVLRFLFRIFMLFCLLNFSFSTTSFLIYLIAAHSRS